MKNFSLLIVAGFMAGVLLVCSAALATEPPLRNDEGVEKLSPPEGPVLKEGPVPKEGSLPKVGPVPKEGAVVLDTKTKPETDFITIPSNTAVTIAVVVMPRQPDGSAWDIGDGADIALCGAAGCYVSNGLLKEATFYAGGEGLRLIKKAGKCRDSLKCVFRGVDISKLQTKDNTAIQLVDVDYVSHKYMEDITITEVETKPENKSGASSRVIHGDCVAMGVVITCKQGFHTPSYSLWVMNEAVAKKGGKQGLYSVLFKGLIDQRVSALADSLLIFRGRVKEATELIYSKLFSISVPSSCLNGAEFLTETFYVMELADANERRAAALLTDLVGRLPRDRLAGLIRRTPAFYWAFLDISLQLERFAKAESYVFEKDEKSLFLEKIQAETKSKIKPDPKLTIDRSEKTENKDNKPLDVEQLTYGWEVRARAKAALAQCGVVVPGGAD